MRKTDKGRHGEHIAVDYLMKNGFDIVDTNYYTRFGEIDIVAKKGNVFRFIEVKTRLGDKYGSAVEAITSAKVRSFSRTVEVFIKRNNLEYEDISLDLIAVDIDYNGTIEIDWIENITL